MHQTTPPLDASPDGGIRKRVCKACDRCRLKKSKCDGASPCGRCKSDNAICVFGERKKAHDKVYPKGYVEMLEQQQSQLVAGLQESYRILLSSSNWPGSPLKPSSNGHPLTHDILETLGALKSDGSSGIEQFEEDTSVLQKRLIAGGAGYMQRQDSSDGGSDSEHSPTFPKPRSNNSLSAVCPPTPGHSPSISYQQMPTQFKTRAVQAPASPPQTDYPFSSIPGESNNPYPPQPALSYGIKSQRGSSLEDIVLPQIGDEFGSMFDTQAFNPSSSLFSGYSEDLIDFEVGTYSNTAFR
ncbi:hypothetical protein FQN54_004278 [Arachnomyces sp. PD_36]|nr:hypothetical protein FQN54_004278 [Arachnomyces sp. PD_36]